MDLDALRLKHGQLTTLEVGGWRVVFRPMPIEDARELGRLSEAAPHLAFELGLAAVQRCLVAGADDYAQIAEHYPLALDIDGGVLERLLKQSSAQAHATVKLAINKWRAADRNLADVAEQLLAFKAYVGGEPSANARAGALHIAELSDSVKGLFKLHLAFMKSMAKSK